MCPETGFRMATNSWMAINCKNDSDAPILLYDIIANFFDAAVFLLLSLVTGPSFMSIS